MDNLIEKMAQLSPKDMELAKKAKHLIIILIYL